MRTVSFCISEFGSAWPRFRSCGAVHSSPVMLAGRGIKQTRSWREKRQRTKTRLCWFFLRTKDHAPFLGDVWLMFPCVLVKYLWVQEKIRIGALRQRIYRRARSESRAKAHLSMKVQEHHDRMSKFRLSRLLRERERAETKEGKGLCKEALLKRPSTKSIATRNKGHRY